MTISIRILKIVITFEIKACKHNHSKAITKIEKWG